MEIIEKIKTNTYQFTLKKEGLVNINLIWENIN